MTNKVFEWIPLDNAGKVFPGQNTNRWSNVFRLSVQLKEEIDPAILKEALSRTFNRIPTFRVRIRNGFFWNYYEFNEMECPVRHDIKNHCYRINFKENNGYLFRVYYHSCRIGIDVYHALCDGYGAAVFISTLTGEYLRLKGHSVSQSKFVLDVNDSPKEEEREDAYILNASSKEKCSLTETMVYHRRGTRLPLHMCNYTTVIMSFEQLHKVSKGYGVTVTELLAAILLDIHYRKQLSQRKFRQTVSVQIPVNLRKAFPSETLRNFVMCLTVNLRPRKDEYAFEEIVSEVSTQLRKANNIGYLNAYITRTVKIGTESIKLLPLVIKNSVIRAGFSVGAEYSTSTLISNLGPIDIPEDMRAHVEKFAFYTGPGIVNGARCGVVSLGDRLAFTFSNRYEERDIENEFLKKLRDMGIDLTVETNRDTDYSDIEGIIVGDGDAYSKEIFIPARVDRKAKLRNPDISFSESLKRYFHL